MSKDARYETDADSVVRLPPKNAGSGHADQLDKAGHTILQLLHKAAGVAEANNQHALEMAQRLSDQLRAAESRIAELEAEVQLYQERSAQAERWLHRVYTEIEERFIRQPHHAAARRALA
jgi:DNA repair exonuclease SbcCD ATPase subunit